MKSLAALLLPNLALWGLLLGLLLTRSRRGGFWLRGCALALVVLSVPALPRATLGLWSLGPVLSAPDTVDGVVVFAAGIGGTAEYGYWPSGASMRRATVGASVAGAMGVPLLITGGGRGDLPSEASVIASALKFNGETILEETARDTWENAVTIAAIARENEWRGFVLVTDGRHGRRAAASLKAIGAPIVGFQPASTPSDFSWLDAVPSVQGLAAWRAVGYEVAASLSYAIKGRIDMGDLWGAVSVPRHGAN